jgi:hypothetical protein
VCVSLSICLSACQSAVHLSSIVPVLSSESYCLYRLGGVFSFLDTFEERSLKLKVSRHEQERSQTKLQSELSEVRIPTLYGLAGDLSGHLANLRSDKPQK